MIFAMMDKMRINADTRAKDLKAASDGCDFVVIAKLQQGFTLLELMVVIGIAGILSTFALPAYQEWTTHSAVNNATRMVMFKLKQARNLAVAENRDVVMRFTQNAFVFDKIKAGRVCVQCKNEVTNFANDYPKVVLTQNVASDLVFNSQGSASSLNAVGAVGLANRTLTLAQGGYSKGLVINMIGRVYEK